MTNLIERLHILVQDAQESYPHMTALWLRALEETCQVVIQTLERMTVPTCAVCGDVGKWFDTQSSLDEPHWIHSTKMPLLDPNFHNFVPQFEYAVKIERICECGCPANKHMLGGGYCGTGLCYTSEVQKEYCMRVYNLPDKPVCSHLRVRQTFHGQT